MAFPQSFMDELIARSDIVDVVGSYVSADAARAAACSGCCPFHNEKTASFSRARRTSRFTTASAAKRAAASSTSSWRWKTCPIPDAVRFLAKRAEHGGAGGGAATGKPDQRAQPAAGAEPGCRPVLLPAAPAAGGGGGAGRIWTTRRSAGAPPCDSAWAPRWTHGTRC